MWQKQSVIPPEELPPQDRQSRFDTGITSMRVHELAVQRWLNCRFLVAEGYPMPVIFSTPMSAYADFKQIWSQPNNVFSYLLDVKSSGRPVYQPHPQPPSYPLITIKRLGWTFSPQRNFGSQWWRHAGWPTVSDNVTKSDFGVVSQTRMPQAWDYKLQLDHYSTRVDGQAHFIQEFQQGFFPSASVPNTWIKAAYPGVFGKKLVRIVLDGSISDVTEEEPVDGYRIYRTSANVVVEGWVPDPDTLIINSFWYEVNRVNAVSHAELDAIYSDSVAMRYNGRFQEIAEVIARQDPTVASTPSASQNIVAYEGSTDTPPAAPPDTTSFAVYSGPSGTLYMWSPTALEWKALISI